MNVLLTSVGRRVALARAFGVEARRLSPGARVLGVDSSTLSAAAHVVDQSVVVPRCLDPGYVPFLLDLVVQHSIKVLVPLIDTELGVLARHRQEFRRIGCEAIVSDPQIIETMRDKAATVARFRELGFGAPRVFGAHELAVPESIPFPVFLKPADGSSSIGARRIKDSVELRFFLERTKAPVVQTLVEGDEYTIDVFVDLGGRVRCVVPRRRLETRAGEVSKGRTVKERRLMEQAASLVERLGGCRGCITLQCMVTPEREVMFFEANMRFGGGFPLSYEAGANFPKWILEMCDGREIADFDGWEDGLMMLRYDEAIFVPRT